MAARAARLANALIVYGVIGLLAAAIGFAALIAASARIGSLGERIVSEAVSLDAIIVLTADVLDDAATTAGSFGPTVAQTSVTVSEAAGAIRDIEPRLRDLETQANAIEIFGQRPVAPLGQLFGQIATDVSGLDEQLDGIATEMGRNEAALTANAESLGALADLVRAYKGRLQAGRHRRRDRRRPAPPADHAGAVHRLDRRPGRRLADRRPLDAPAGRARSRVTGRAARRAAARAPTVDSSDS